MLDEVELNTEDQMQGVLDKLHILTYESSLTASDCKKLKSAGYGKEIVWLKKKKRKKNAKVV